MSYLDRILEEKKREVGELASEHPARRYYELQGSLAVTRDFTAALRRTVGGLRLIAEIKKASPSRGLIVRDFDPVAMAKHYGELGAAAYSVLTDRTFFQGSIDYLQMVSRSFALPVLRKEFIIDESQIFQSRLIGADAILLIVAALDESQLGDYLQLAAAIGLHVLVEVHDHKELEMAIEKGEAGTLEKTPASNPKDFGPIRGRKAKVNKETGEIWEKDLLHKDHWEVYKNKRDFEDGVRDRAIWGDGRFKNKF